MPDKHFSLRLWFQAPPRVLLPRFTASSLTPSPKSSPVHPLFHPAAAMPYLPAQHRPTRPAPILDEKRARKIAEKREKEEKKRGDALTSDELDRIAIMTEELCQAIVAPDLVLSEIICFLCDHADVDVQSKIFQKLISRNGLMMQYLELCISGEIRQTETKGTVFRANSFAVGVISFHSRSVGKAYLRGLLGPLINQIITSEKSYEIDPAKIKAKLPPDATEETLNDTVASNAANLLAALDKFFSTIVESLSSIPDDWKQIAMLLSREVKKKFPSALNYTVGGFYFLRLICPSIVSPDGFGVISSSVPPTARRPLVLISKVIQNLANETVPKEAFMSVVKDWMNSVKPQMEQFLSSLASLHGSETISPPPPAQIVTGISTALTEKERESLATFLHKLKQRIGAVMALHSRRDEIDHNPASALDHLDELKALLSKQASLSSKEKEKSDTKKKKT